MTARPKRNGMLALLLMALAALLARVAAPNAMLADTRARLALDAVVPESFGAWRLDRSASTVLVEPALQRAIDAVYTQTLSRVYVDPQGERIMLVVAYGRDQSDSFQVHLPEGCYQGQGFAVHSSAPGSVATPFGAIPAQRMIAERQARREAVTYWVVVGDRLGAGDWERKKIKLAYALERTAPDGVLVRVSSIGSDTRAAFVAQQRFISAMLGAVSGDGRRALLGEGRP
ncbi:exosortase-associated protein EpsI, B-type [Massilia sp.]|uniref:exosortase-associated protein EpsI, B-type n=1 Tax=Massilia sp. TaxID=1882437 RepID=UPI0028A15315|nr:exosortase-associated protein EpsI, B-type [Massilia sp.]